MKSFESVIENLNEVIESWMLENGFEMTADFNPSGFFYYDSDRHIEYCFELPDLDITSWNDFLEELNCPYDIDTFYTSLLHEIGHYCTFPLVSMGDMIYSESETDRLSKSQPSYEVNMEYYHLPRELAATHWAVDYIINNPAQVKRLIMLTQPLMKIILFKYLLPR